MKNVHVVAWHYNGGAGFDWYPSEKDADVAFDEEKINATLFQKSEWAAFRFDVSVSEFASDEAITEQIDGDLDGLCADSSTIKFPVGRQQ